MGIRDERGEIVIESMLVLTTVLFVLVFLLNLGFFYYQQWNVQITANETASKVAEVYPIIESKLSEGVSDYNQIMKIEKYRNLLSKDKYTGENRARGKEYGRKYISLVSLSYGIGEPEIQIKTVEDAFASKHIEAKVKATYRLPFSEGFQFFGFKPTYEFEGTGFAVVSDLSDYLGTVNFLENLDSIMHFDDLGITSAINSVLGLISSIVQCIKSFLE